MLRAYQASVRLRPVFCAAACALGLSSLALPAIAAEPFVAGTAPDQRPPSAPHLATFNQTPETLAKATAGISQPLPPTLKFLNDQGAWYTPFNRPGMPGLYDIRGLHAATAATAAEPAGAAPKR